MAILTRLPHIRLTGPRGLTWAGKSPVALRGPATRFYDPRPYGDHPQRRGQPPRPPPHRSAPQWRRFRGNLPPGGLRLVSVDHPGPPPAGRRLLIGVSGQARTRAAGGTRWRRQELPGPGAGLLGRPRRTHRALQPRRRLLQGHGTGQSGQLRRPRFPVLPDARFADPG